MNYGYFSEMEAGTLIPAEGESEQAFMERVLRAVIEEPTEDTVVDRFNERMTPSFYSCSAEDRSVSVLFKTEEWMLNPNGTLHGGIASAAVDIVMSVLARYLAKKRVAVTVQLNVNFMKPIQRGQPFIVHVTADHSGRRCIVTHAHVTAGDSPKPLITATGVLM